MTPPLRIVFMGSDPIALPLLEWLMGEVATQAELVAVYTQPDRAVGRGQKVVANAIKTWALARGLPVRQPEKLTESIRIELSDTKADLALVMAYGHILKDEFITTPRLGTLNLHASILPKYRGASPIQTAIAAGERQTGVSLMRIVRALDAGPVADIETVPIALHDTALDVEAKLAVASVPLLRRNLGRLAAGTLTFTEQDHAAATFCRRLTKDDGRIDFHASAAVLAARINGLFPWPACRVEIGGQSVTFGLAEAVEGEGEPGKVLASDASGLRVGTGGGCLRVLRLQRPGGRMLAAAEFLRGFSIPVGETLASSAMPALVRL